jgi:hypothetical protein
MRIISRRRQMKCIKFYFFLFFIFCCAGFSASAQKRCDACSVPSFAALTVYHVLQTGPSMGFGIEAGKWKKDAGKFSYFLGTSLVWEKNKSSNQKTSDPYKELNISFYWKGQFKLADRFYLIVQPELINLSAFETRTAVRYVFPLTKIMGIGLEPGYALINREWSLNTNVHFALR